MRGMQGSGVSVQRLDLRNTFPWQIFKPRSDNPESISLTDSWLLQHVRVGATINTNIDVVLVDNEYKLDSIASELSSAEIYHVTPVRGAEAELRDLL